MWPIIPYDKGDIYLVGQFLYPINSYSWEIPAGGVNDGEALEDAAKRELKEETGLTANKLTKIAQVLPNCGISNQKIHIFMAEDLKSGIASPEGTEEITLKKISLTEAIR